MDLRLFEDDGERGGALDPNAVVRNAASEGQDGNGERVGVSTGADTKANTRRGSALERDHGATLEPLAELGDALGGVGAVAITIDAAELVAGQTAKEGGVSTGADRTFRGGSSASWLTRALAELSCPLVLLRGRLLLRDRGCCLPACERGKEAGVLRSVNGC